MIVLSIYAIIVTVAFLLAVHESRDAKLECQGLKDKQHNLARIHLEDLKRHEQLIEQQASMIRALQAKPEKIPIPIKAPVVESQPKPEDWQAELSRLLKEEDESLQKE